MKEFTQAWCILIDVMTLAQHNLGKTNMRRETKVRAEEKFPISGQGFTRGNCLMILTAKYC